MTLPWHRHSGLAYPSSANLFIVSIFLIFLILGAVHKNSAFEESSEIHILQSPFPNHYVYSHTQNTFQIDIPNRSPSLLGCLAYVAHLAHVLHLQNCSNPIELMFNWKDDHSGNHFSSLCNGHDTHFEGENLSRELYLDIIWHIVHITANPCLILPCVQWFFSFPLFFLSFAFPPNVGSLIARTTMSSN